MFSLVLVSACASLATAAPHYVGSPVIGHTVVEEPGVAQVGEFVEHTPSAVSYQSQTQYHTRKYKTPIIAPVFKTYPAPEVVGDYNPFEQSYLNHVVPVSSVDHVPVKDYSAPVFPVSSLYRTSLLRSYEYPTYPVAKAFHTQTVHPEGVLTTYERSPLYTTVRKTHFPATVKSYPIYVQK